MFPCHHTTIENLVITVVKNTGQFLEWSDFHPKNSCCFQFDLIRFGTAKFALPILNLFKDQTLLVVLLPSVYRIKSSYKPNKLASRLSGQISCGLLICALSLFPLILVHVCPTICWISLRFPFERIDGRIQGPLRQEAIDRFTAGMTAEMQWIYFVATA